MNDRERFLARKRVGGKRLTGRQYLVQFCNQRRKMARDDLPDDIEVHAVVAVGQTVTQSDDLPPRNLRILVSLRLGDAAGGLADNFQQANNRQVDCAVGQEPLTSGARQHT